jgi:hypothetical protein
MLVDYCSVGEVVVLIPIHQDLDKRERSGGRKRNDIPKLPYLV